MTRRSPIDDSPGDSPRDGLYPPGVLDFTVAGEDGGAPVEEELVAGARRPPNRARLAAAVAVPAAAVAVVALLHSSHSPRKPDAAPPPVHQTSRPKAAVTVPPSGLLLHEIPQAPADVTAYDPKSCPEAGDGSPVCSASRRLPRPVTAAITSRFPAARSIRGLDEEVRDTGSGPGGVWYREVHARIGRLRLSITVTQRPVQTPEEVANLPDVITFSSAVEGRYVHTVVHVPTGGAAPVARVLALTSDRRLVAPAR